MAAYIVWRDFYSVNEPSLDAEHRQIIESINELYDAWESPAATAATKHVLDRLVQYTHTHFDHEEKVMRDVGYPKAEYEGAQGPARRHAAADDRPADALDAGHRPRRVDLPQGLVVGPHPG